MNASMMHSGKTARREIFMKKLLAILTALTLCLSRCAAQAEAPELPGFAVGR